MRVIFDHNLSPRLARAFHELFRGEHEVIALRDKFDPSIKDVDLINELSRSGRWAMISGDRRITRNRAERTTFSNSRLVGFFLSRGLYKASVIKQAERLLALWEPMKKAFSVVEGGAMFELPTRSIRLKQLKD